MVVPTVAIHTLLLVLAPLFVAVFGSEQARAMDAVAIWNHWDAPHFIEVAQRGYDPTGDPARSVLFPLLPLLIRIGSVLLSPVVAGMLVAFVSTLVAALGLYRLVRQDSGRGLAIASVVALNVFPTAYFLVAPYSEAPFLAFTVWSFIAARQGRWTQAGLLGMLAALTRLQGAFLLPALLVEYWSQRRRLDRAVLGLAFIVVGPVVFLAINAYAYGDPLFFLAVQRRIFTVENVAPWATIGTLLGAVVNGGTGETWATVYLAPLVAFAVLAAASLWATVSRASRPSYAAYAWLNLLTLSTLNWPISVPRYLLDVFPIFIAQGALARRPGLGQAVTALSVLLLGAFMTLYLMGHWAF